MGATFPHIHQPLSRPVTPADSTILGASTYGGITLFACTSQSNSARHQGTFALKQPPAHHICIALLQHIRFGLFPFRSPLIRESRLISFPHPTQMLHFGRFAVPCLRKGLSLRTRFSFGDRWINGCMLLPSAYRSLPRPSSLLKPSHSPSDVFAPVTLELTRLCMAIIVNSSVSYYPLRPSPCTFVQCCIFFHMHGSCVLYAPGRKLRR